jgi:hypothetical protein
MPVETFVTIILELLDTPEKVSSLCLGEGASVMIWFPHFFSVQFRNKQTIQIETETCYFIAIFSISRESNFFYYF